jgi:hypothetical protein
MKKFILIATLLFAAFTSQAQKPISKMDSTRATVTVQPQNYTYNNVYVVINSINIGGGMYAPMPLQENAADSININANVVLYASKSAFESGSQSLTSIQVNVRIPNSGTIPNHYQLKEKIFAKL